MESPPKSSSRPMRRRRPSASYRKSNRYRSSGHGQERNESPHFVVQDWLHGSLNFLGASVLLPLLRWAFRIFWLVLELSSPFMAIGIVLYLATTLVFSLNPFGGVSIPFPSPCSLPIVSLLPQCRGLKAEDAATSRANSLDSLINAQSFFANVLDLAQDADPVPLQIRISEISLTHLRNIIQYQTQLPSKQQIALELDTFIDTSRMAVDDLITYSSDLGSAVDTIVHMNAHTLRMLETAQSQRSSGSVSQKRSLAGTQDLPVQSGLMPRLISAMVPASLAPRLAYTDKDIVAQYIKHAGRMEQQIVKLIDKGTALQRLLDAMNSNMNRIGELTAQDKGSLLNDQERLLSQLWTMLGGNVADRMELERNIGYANLLEHSWGQSMIVVGQTLIELKKIQARVKEVREALQPDPLGFLGSQEMDALELESHIHKVEGSLKSLRDRREQANKRIQENERRAFDGDNDLVLPSGDSNVRMGYKLPKAHIDAQR